MEEYTYENKQVCVTLCNEGLKVPLHIGSDFSDRLWICSVWLITSRKSKIPFSFTEFQLRVSSWL